MLKLTDKKVTQGKLSDELVAAGLPIKGIARLSREIDENGRVVLVDGKPKKVTPYILITGDFSKDEERAIQAMVDTHIPDPEPTAVEIAEKEKEDRLNQPVMKALIEVLAKRMGVTEAEIRGEVKGAMV